MPFFASLRPALRRLRRGLDAQTAAVLMLAPLLMIAQFKLGGRSFFRTHLAPLLPPDATGLWPWAWWFGMQGVLGFALPALVLRLGFRQTAAEAGLGLGDARLALRLTLAYAAVVVVGAWYFSAGLAFQASYPHFRAAAYDWRLFARYETLYLCYWIGWEYLWRGFLLFGTRRTLGYYAILVQAIPFALLHLQKPAAEAVLSLPGGILLGLLVWRCRAFWAAVPLHAVQMLALDFWCALRLRSGVGGAGPAALAEALRVVFGPAP